ncbi:hypothetical protein [Delftia sp. PS-11]|uniref:hypothetical protein n=1 Tax=Delftia sp. PS-11 TaxID=2767222 RepID=UPI0024559E20|nr:hypothetical protein [Delftia sp. PS-11]KAJ8740778.1 hypothetical protein H9T68_22795 [Delftia sp. PS-11]
MNIPPSHDALLAEHTFGRDRISPPPLALETQSDDHTLAACHDGCVPLDLDQRIRNVGEW